MVTREDKIRKSVTIYAKAKLAERGYDDEVQWVESFDYEPEQELAGNVIAAGFEFDDQGEAAECGSDLIKRLYTIEFVVLGTTLTFARNIASALKFALQGDQAIPLLDVGVTGQAQIDVLEVIGVNSEREILPDPEPWQEFIWTTRIRVEDYYYASLV